MDMDYESTENNGRSNIDAELSNESTTIDASVATSRISQSASLQKEQQTMELEQDNSTVAVEQPHFPRLTASQATGKRVEYRRVRCPPHRYTPLREHWEQILTPLVEYLKLQVRARKKERTND